MTIPRSEWNEFRKENNDSHDKITELLTNHNTRITKVETNQWWFTRIFSGIFAIVSAIVIGVIGIFIKGK